MVKILKTASVLLLTTLLICALILLPVMSAPAALAESTQTDAGSPGGDGRQDQTAADIQNRLVIATTDNGPVSIDRLLYLAMRNTNYNVDFISPVIREGYIQANEGIADGVIAGYPGLETVYTNLVPIPIELERISVRVFAREGSELEINSWDELGGMTVGILENRTYILERLPENAIITEKETNRAVLNGLINNEYDVSVLVERDHETVGEMLSIARVGVVDTLYDRLYLNKKHEAYVPVLTAALAELFANGSADQILSNIPLPGLNQKRTVVHIISSSVEISRQDRFTTELRSRFEDDMTMEWITVNLDARRFTRGQHNMAFIASLLRADIVSRNISAVIVSGDTALDFLNDYYYLYFRGTPVLFYAVSENYGEIIKDNEHLFTGIVQNIEALKTFEKALEIFPDTTDLYVINDYTDEGKLYRNAIEKELAGYTGSVNITYNDNMPIAYLLEHLGSLHDNTLVLMGSYFVDANHQYYTMGEIKRLMERNCAVPIFSLYSKDPPYNSVGGRCLDFELLGDEIADMLDIILDGGTVDDIPIVQDSRHLNRWVFDQVQLDRFGISARLLPEDAYIVNGVLSVREANPQLFAAMITLAMLCIIIIIGASLFVIVNQKHTRQNEKLREAAQAANRAKSNFLANMSHEMRTPLTTVLGLTELTIETVQLDDDTLSNLIKVYRAGETLLGLVNDVLDISKIEAGKFEINEHEYELPSLINDTITQSSLYMNDKPIEFKLNITDDLPNYLYGDDLRVRQIMNNLLSNAFKFTAKGEVELSIRSSREGDDVWLTISVKDTGIGIRGEDMDKLFTMYSKLGEEEDSASRRTDGNGLGLSITKRVAEMMSGSVSVQSEYGVGSTFTIKILQKYVNDAVMGAEVAENLRTYDYSFKKFENARMSRINLSYARVLVVDDNPTNLDVARGLMSLYGMTVDCVLSGQEAIDAVRDAEGRYCAIFMDHMMPGMDGIEATRKIRETGTDYAKNIPVIALTANAIVGNEEMFLKNGFQAFISKPIDLSKLDAALRRWVRDKEAEALLPERTISVTRGARDMSESKIYIPGLDIQKGIMHFGSEETYLNVLRSYARNNKPLLEAIKEPAEDSLSGYTVVVHGIKGASYGIFAGEVGRLASSLERAASVGDYEFVAGNNARFLDATRQLIEDIETATSDAAGEKQKKERPDKEVLSKFLEACKNYDIDEMDAAMNEIGRYQYTGDDGLAEWLRANLEQGNYKGIRKRLEEN